MAGRIGIAALALTGALVACGAADEQPRSVVLVVVDTLRADALESYGAPPGSAPAVRAIARRGTVIEAVFASAPWTGPSVVAMLTGRYPDEVGVRELRDPLPESVTTLAQRFQRAGYVTGSVVSNALAGPPYGHDKGYDFLHFERYKEGPGEAPTFRADAVVDAALPWLEERLAHPQRPFFLYLHTCDPHEPYLPVEPFAERFTADTEPLDDELILSQGYVRERMGSATLEALRARYAAEVAAADAALARLFERLPEDVLVTVISDHGEEFLEHDGLLHGHTLYQELLHVPWILAGPGVPAGRVGARVSHVDLPPTLLELAGVPFDPLDFSGHSVVPALRGEPLAPSPRPLHAVLEDGSRHTLSLRRGRWKLVHGLRRGNTRLFDLESDPDESRDVSAEHPELTAELLQLALGRLEAIVPIDEVEDPARAAAREAELRAIGYAR